MEVTDARATRRSVLASLAADCLQTLMLGAAAWFTGSVAMRSQVAAAAADIAVQMFLLVGVLSSNRPSDDAHPLGYGRERFFWSFLGALGIFVGGGGFALEQAVESALHPSAPGHYAIAYAVLAATIALDAFALATELRPLRRQAHRRGVPLRALVRRSTDPAATTVVVAGGGGVICGVVAVAGLMVSQTTRSATPDTLASLLTGLLLLGASGFLLRTNRELLSGRGVPLSMLRGMREIVSAERGVLDVPDLFAVVVGPSSLIVNGDVTLEDDLDVPEVEQMIMRAGAALRKRWPSIDYVYLTPVPRARVQRGGAWFSPTSAAARCQDPAQPTTAAGRGRGYR